jgi:hypothetical protein
MIAGRIPATGKVKSQGRESLLRQQHGQSPHRAVKLDVLVAVRAAQQYTAVA